MDAVCGAGGHFCEGMIGELSTSAGMSRSVAEHTMCCHRLATAEDATLEKATQRLVNHSVLPRRLLQCF